VNPRVQAALAAAARPVCAYVYDRATLADRAAALRAALPAGAGLYYAVKANSHPAVLAALAPHVDGFDVASTGELAKTRGFGKKVVYGGPGKTDAALAAMVEAAGAADLIAVESPHELRRLCWLAEREVKVLLRVNRPGGDLTGSHRMAGAPTQFGLDPELLAEAVALAVPPVRLVGFHLHAVSNNLDAAAHADFVADALDWSVTAARRTGVDLAVVDVGGGLGLPYTGERGPFDLAAFAAGLAGLEVPAGVRLLFEPGRWLAGPAGWYATEVLDLKCTHGAWYAVVRGGTHHFRLPAAWGYSHPFTVLPVDGWPYPWARPEVRDTAVTVAGELCTPRDVLARDTPVARLRVGDVLVFGDAGAYGWDISHHDFLSHPHPEVLVS
jgi:2-[(L-alanin-3-ylcarbamoyl)methyl]-2-hydroxybutanedioate decarboxylase